MSKNKYWTMIGDQICSEHLTLPAALKAAKRCEARGGIWHQIFKVREIKRKRR